MPELADLGFFDGDTFRASRMDWFPCDAEFSDHQTLASRGLASPEAFLGLNLILGTQPPLPGEQVLHSPNSPATDRVPNSRSALGQDRESNDVYNNDSARTPADDELAQPHPVPNNLRPGYDVSSNKENEEIWPAVLDRGGNEMWPFDYTSNQSFRIIKLPPLRQILEDTVGRRPAIEKATMLDLIKNTIQSSYSFIERRSNLGSSPCCRVPGQAR